MGTRERFPRGNEDSDARKAPPGIGGDQKPGTKGILRETDVSKG